MTTPDLPAPPQTRAQTNPVLRGRSGACLGWRRRLTTFGAPPRIVGLDIARGLAVLGMIAAHTLELPDSFVWTKPGTWIEIVDGRSSILFGLLAGISIALMTGRNRIPSGAELGPMRLKLLARGLLIFGIGLALEALGTDIAIILCFYGFIYMASVMIIGLRVRALLIWAACLALAGPAVMSVATVMSGGGGEGLTFVLGGTYSALVWGALMLGGLALGRMDVTRRKVAAVGLAVGLVLAAVGYTTGTLFGSNGGDGSSSSDDVYSGSYDDDTHTIPGSEADLDGKVCDDYGGGYLECYPEDEADSEDGSASSFEGEDGEEGWFAYSPMGSDGPTWALESNPLEAFLDATPHSGGSMEILGSGGFALALVCLLLLTGRALRYVVLPIAALGSMPLSTYSIHVVLIWALTTWVGMSQGALLFWIVAGSVLVAATIWAVLVGKGPLERLSVRVGRRLSSP